MIIVGTAKHHRDEPLGEGISSCSRASTCLPNPGRADLQSAVWNRRFGIYTAGFSTALAIIAFENCFRKFSIHIPNRRFQTADCRSALPGFGKYVDALCKEGNTLVRYI